MDNIRPSNWPEFSSTVGSTLTGAAEPPPPRGGAAAGAIENGLCVAYRGLPAATKLERLRSEPTGHLIWLTAGTTIEYRWASWDRGG